MAVCAGSRWFGVFGSYYTTLGNIGESVGDEKRVASDLLNLLLGQIMTVAPFKYVGYQFFADLLI